MIAAGVETRDILAVTLLGHRGVLVVHKQMQVRFYEIPRDPTQPWPAQDLYSFYTPSREGGLGLADIDGDGLPDILCGNDWIRSPKAVRPALAPVRHQHLERTGKFGHAARWRIATGVLVAGPAGDVSRAPGLVREARRAIQRRSGRSMRSRAIGTASTPWSWPISTATASPICWWATRAES